MLEAFLIVCAVVLGTILIIGVSVWYFLVHSNKYTSSANVPYRRGTRRRLQPARRYPGALNPKRRIAKYWWQTTETFEHFRAHCKRLKKHLKNWMQGEYLYINTAPNRWQRRQMLKTA